MFLWEILFYDIMISFHIKRQKLKLLFLYVEWYHVIRICGHSAKAVMWLLKMLLVYHCLYLLISRYIVLIKIVFYMIRDRFISKCHVTNIGIPIINLRWDNDCLIFIMGISIMVKSVSLHWISLQTLIMNGKDEYHQSILTCGRCLSVHSVVCLYSK